MFGNNRAGALGLVGHSNEGPPIVASAPQVPQLFSVQVKQRSNSQASRTRAQLPRAEIRTVTNFCTVVEQLDGTLSLCRTNS